MNDVNGLTASEARQAELIQLGRCPRCRMALSATTSADEYGPWSLCLRCDELWSAGPVLVRNVPRRQYCVMPAFDEGIVLEHHGATENLA